MTTSRLPCALSRARATARLDERRRVLRLLEETPAPLAVREWMAATQLLERVRLA